MSVNRVVKRVVGLLVRWGVIKHPYGREYAREQYTVTGRHAPTVAVDTVDEPSMRLSPRHRAVLVGTTLLLLSFVAAGVLVVG
jgi:hypothetical protein